MEEREFRWRERGCTRSYETLRTLEKDCHILFFFSCVVVNGDDERNARRLHFAAIDLCCFLPFLLAIIATFPLSFPLTFSSVTDSLHFCFYISFTFPF